MAMTLRRTLRHAKKQMRRLDAAKGKSLSEADRRTRWTQSLDSDHTCLRAVCDDGSTSYPLCDRPLSMGPIGADEATAIRRIVAEYIAAGHAASRIPACPPKPRP